MSKALENLVKLGKSLGYEGTELQTFVSTQQQMEETRRKEELEETRRLRELEETRRLQELEESKRKE